MKIKKKDTRHSLNVTCDINESATLLLTLHKTVVAHVSGGPSSSIGSEIGLPPKRGADPFVRQLCCTKGISVTRAKSTTNLFL